jgi:hypothetical protein
MRLWNLVVKKYNEEIILESFYNLKDAKEALDNRITLWYHLGKDSRYSYKIKES